MKIKGKSEGERETGGKKKDAVNCLRNDHVEVRNVGGSRISVIIGTGAVSAIRIAIVSVSANANDIENVKKSMSGTGIGVNVRAMMIAADRKTMVGVIEARRDLVKVMIQIGRRCDIKVGISIIIISFYYI